MKLTREAPEGGFDDNMIRELIEGKRPMVPAFGMHEPLAMLSEIWQSLAGAIEDFVVASRISTNIHDYMGQVAWCQSEYGSTGWGQSKFSQSKPFSWRGQGEQIVEPSGEAATMGIESERDAESRR